MLKYTHILAIAILLLLITSCASRKIEICKMRLRPIDNIYMNDVNISEVSSLNDFNPSEEAILMKGYARKNLPLRIESSIDFKNSNDKRVLLNSFEWEAYIDEEKIATGAVNRIYEIPAKGISTVPISIQLNVMEIINKQGQKSIIQFGIDLAEKNGHMSRLMLKIKPVFTYNKRLIHRMPDYITLK